MVGKGPAETAQARRRRDSRGTHPRRRHRDRRRARLRGHQHRPGQREVRAAGQLDLLAFQEQGRPDRRGHRAQLRRLARGVAGARREAPRVTAWWAWSMQIAKALLDSPDFLRLGLMLALERRPVGAAGAGDVPCSCGRRRYHDAGRRPCVRSHPGARPTLRSTSWPPTRSPAPTACSSPRRSAATPWTCWRCSSCMPSVLCTTVHERLVSRRARLMTYAQGDGRWPSSVPATSAPT